MQQIKISTSKTYMFFYEKNEEGKISIQTHSKCLGNKYMETDFIYDSFKLLNEYQLRVSITDATGQTKHGLICLCGGDDIELPCVFDKVKPFDTSSLLALIGDDEYVVDKWGHVFQKELYLQKLELEKIRAAKELEEENNKDL